MNTSELTRALSEAHAELELLRAQPLEREEELRKSRQTAELLRHQYSSVLSVVEEQRREIFTASEQMQALQKNYEESLDYWKKRALLSEERTIVVEAEKDTTISAWLKELELLRQQLVSLSISAEKNGKRLAAVTTASAPFLDVLKHWRSLGKLNSGPMPRYCLSSLATEHFLSLESALKEE